MVKISASNSTGKRKVHKVMKEHKEGTLKSGSGKKVKSRKQAVAIALSEARASGAKIPKRKRSPSQSAGRCAESASRGRAEVQDGIGSDAGGGES